MKIRKLLIANRGEIARRVIATARKQGIRTVGVYSDADAHCPFVSEADEAVRIGPPAASESYLSFEALIDAARRTGADALHPGYGFLSENADFARAVQGAGIVWVGPSPAAIDAMGSKASAKSIMEEHGVPIVPGYSGEDQSPERLEKEALALGFPVLLKASAGGGGKGMRIVREAEALSAAIVGAQREALSSFGEGRLLIERYVDRPRHIEFQILGDSHGNLVHLFERECSIQRRHQKVLEEAPSPAVDEALRARMAEAAIAAGRAIGYTSAGTVEFIVAPDDSFYFLEVNTRLQVEHPVTELTTGHDLVALQLLVAEGGALPFAQSDLVSTGHAIEARVYAEDPSREFLPATGTLLEWAIPEAEGLRVDSGVEQGTEVSVHYDPMLAKVIAYGADRAEATRRLATALQRAAILGVTTNRRFLCEVLTSDAWRDAELHTHFIAEHEAALTAPPDAEAITRAAIMATCIAASRGNASRTLLPGLAYGWRNSRFRDESYSWALEPGGEPITVLVGQDAPGTWRVALQGTPAAKADDESAATHRVSILGQPSERTTLELDGVARTVTVREDEDIWWVHDGFETVTLHVVPEFPDATAADADGECVAPMPGKVLSIAVAAGDVVKEGDVLVILEAMKMEHSLTAAADGTVGEVLATEGQQVDGGAPLVVMETPD